jgi:hypothetical protein
MFPYPFSLGKIIELGFHVLPKSIEISANARHCFLFWPGIGPSNDAGASHVPSDNTIGLFFTGPLPPLSFFTVSFGSDQVFPPSRDLTSHVSQNQIFHPSLKYKTISFSHDPKLAPSPSDSPAPAQNKTGFQCGSPPFRSGSGLLYGELCFKFFPSYGLFLNFFAANFGFVHIPVSSSLLAVQMPTSSAPS